MSLHAVDWFTIGGSAASAIAIFTTLIIYHIQRNAELKSKKKEYDREFMALKIILGIHIDEIKSNISKLLALCEELKGEKLAELKFNFSDVIYRFRFTSINGKVYKSISFNMKNSNYIRENLIYAARTDGELLEKYVLTEKCQSKLINYIEKTLVVIEEYDLKESANVLADDRIEKLNLLYNELIPIETWLDLKPIDGYLK